MPLQNHHLPNFPSPKKPKGPNCYLKKLNSPPLGPFQYIPKNPDLLVDPIAIFLQCVQDLNLHPQSLHSPPSQLCPHCGFKIINSNKVGPGSRYKWGIEITPISRVKKNHPILPLGPRVNYFTPFVSLDFWGPPCGHIGPQLLFKWSQNPSAPDSLLVFDPSTKGETIPSRQGLPHEHETTKEAPAVKKKFSKMLRVSMAPSF